VTLLTLASDTGFCFVDAPPPEVSQSCHVLIGFENDVAATAAIAAIRSAHGYELLTAITNSAITTSA
jgi:hypothetical protein